MLLDGGGDAGQLGAGSGAAAGWHAALLQLVSRAELDAPAPLPEPIDSYFASRALSAIVAADMRSADVSFKSIAALKLARHLHCRLADTLSMHYLQVPRLSSLARDTGRSESHRELTDAKSLLDDMAQATRHFGEVRQRVEDSSGHCTAADAEDLHRTADSAEATLEHWKSDALELEPMLMACDALLNQYWLVDEAHWAAELAHNPYLQPALAQHSNGEDAYTEAGTSAVDVAGPVRIRCRVTTWLGDRDSSRGMVDGAREVCTLNRPYAAIVRGEDLLFTETHNHSLRVADRHGNVRYTHTRASVHTCTLACTPSQVRTIIGHLGPSMPGPTSSVGSMDGPVGADGTARLNMPHGLCLLSDGSIAIADSGSHSIRGVRTHVRIGACVQSRGARYCVFGLARVRARVSVWERVCVCVSVWMFRRVSVLSHVSVMCVFVLPVCSDRPVPVLDRDYRRCVRCGGRCLWYWAQLAVFQPVGLEGGRARKAACRRPR